MQCGNVHRELFFAETSLKPKWKNKHCKTLCNTWKNNDVQRIFARHKQITPNLHGRHKEQLVPTKVQTVPHPSWRTNAASLIKLHTYALPVHPSHPLSPSNIHPSIHLQIPPLFGTLTAPDGQVWEGEAGANRQLALAGRSSSFLWGNGGWVAELGVFKASVK